MYRKVPEFKRYTSEEALFVTVLSAIIFLVGCTFVGYGVYVTRSNGIDSIRPIPKFFPIEVISNILGGNYMKAVIIGWIIGVLCLVAGLWGFASVIRHTAFSLLKRRR